jgi:tripartite-type tricarboxylate transporter receptor subunit TctC
VAGITREPLVMLVHPSVVETGVAEFIATAKTAAVRIKTASAGPGSSPHMAALLFRMLAGIELEVVHYAGGGPALKDLIAGNARLMFEPMSASIEPIRAGKLRALAVTTTARSPALPELPSLGDFVAGYEASAVTGVGVPAHTPAEIIDRLNREINAAFADPAMRARLGDTGGMALQGTPADFGRLMTEETEKWGKVIRSAGTKP